MPNTYLDKAIAAIPKFEERISLFTKKLRLAQYADSTIRSLREPPGTTGTGSCFITRFMDAEVRRSSSLWLP